MLIWVSESVKEKGKGADIGDDKLLNCSRLLSAL
jgi:hypothetical protein